MLKGIHLTLMIGPGIPVPAPAFVVDALTSAQVTSGKDRGGFQLMFTVEKKSLLLTTLLPAGFLDPIITRVILIATLNGLPNVLMDGLVTNQELAPSNQAGQFHLTITGEDLSLAMDLVEKILPFPGIPEVPMLYSCLAPYLALGVIPLVIPPIIMTYQLPTEGWVTQRETDRAFIKSWAQQCGYIFCVIPGPGVGQSIAYFGPDINLPIPQPALSINLDTGSNVESLSFSLNGLAKKITLYTILDPISETIPIPVPNLNLFKPQLGSRPTIPARYEFAERGAEMKIDKAAQAILGELMTAPAAVSGTGALDVMRYKTILRPRMLVGVRGAGVTYDGMYYVDSVTHNIKRGEYKQNFTLSRDGLISNTPFVLP